jgi:hypothetical protein
VVQEGKFETSLQLERFEQFHRVANIWFLIVSVLQMLPFKRLGLATLRAGASFRPKPEGVAFERIERLSWCP